MTSSTLQQFLDAVAANPSLQQQCSQLSSLKELADLARATGFAVTLRDLQLWAHHEIFDAAWWPWSGAGQHERLTFFRSQT